MVVYVKRKAEYGNGYKAEFIESTGCDILMDENNNVTEVYIYRPYLKETVVSADDLVEMMIDGKYFKK